MSITNSEYDSDMSELDTDSVDTTSAMQSSDKESSLGTSDQEMETSEEQSDTESCCDTESSSDTESTSSEEDSSTAPNELPSHPSMRECVSDNCDLNVFDSHLFIYQFSITHCLSMVATEELLRLLRLHVPQGQLPRSAYKLKQFFSSMFPDLISSIHYYCKCCHRLLSDSSTCSEPTCTGSSKESFISVPLQSQLKRKLEGNL